MSTGNDLAKRNLCVWRILIEFKRKLFLFSTKLLPKFFQQLSEKIDNFILSTLVIDMQFQVGA